METATRLTELAAPLLIPLLLNTEATSTSTKTSPGQLTHLGEQICFKYLLPLSSNYSHHSLFQTLVHQIGHSLGLSHSNVYDSVMFPFVKTFNASSPLNFHREDIKAIQTLYGEKTGGVDLSTAQEAASEKQNPSSLFCNDHPQQEPEGKGTYVQTPPSTQSSELLMGTPMCSRGRR